MATPSRRPPAGPDAVTHVALLRAVNVGGRSLAAMVEVRAALAEAGFGAVASVARAPFGAAPDEGLTILALAHHDAIVLSRAVGRGRYGFPNGLVEKVFGVLATTRNWNTVVKMAGEASRIPADPGRTARPRAPRSADHRGSSGGGSTRR